RPPSRRCQVRREAGHKFVRTPDFWTLRTAKPKGPRKGTLLPRDKTLEDIHDATHRHPKHLQKKTEDKTRQLSEVADVFAGRSRVSAIKEEDLPDNLRAMKPERRAEEVDRQMSQRKALNEK